MPPQALSRYLFCTGFSDDEGNLQITEPVPFRYVDRDDNTLHQVSDGDTWWSLAAQYFQGVTRPAGLWWVIAHFQPTPVIDPTVQPSAGTIVVIPSLRCVIEEVFNETRRSEFSG